MEIVRPYPGLERGMKRGPGVQGRTGRGLGKCPAVGFKGPVTSLRLTAWGEVGTGAVGRPQRGLRKRPWVGFGDRSLALSTAETALPPPLGRLFRAGVL